MQPYACRAAQSPGWPARTRGEQGSPSADSTTSMFVCDVGLTRWKLRKLLRAASAPARSINGKLHKVVCLRHSKRRGATPQQGFVRIVQQKASGLLKLRGMRCPFSPRSLLMQVPIRPAPIAHGPCATSLHVNPGSWGIEPVVYPSVIDSDRCGCLARQVFH